MIRDENMVYWLAEQVPRVHHLLKLARDCGMALAVEQEEFPRGVTAYNLKGRYPDCKQIFAKKTTHDFTANRIEQIREVEQWLKSQISGGFSNSALNQGKSPRETKFSTTNHPEWRNFV